MVFALTRPPAPALRPPPWVVRLRQHLPSQGHLLTLPACLVVALPGEPCRPHFLGRRVGLGPRGR